MAPSAFPLSHILSLPLELRQQIYAYVLPTNKTGNSIHDCNWHSGSVSILRVNKQIHIEAVALLFASVTFNIRVECDRILIIKTYIFPNRKISLKTRLAFPEALGRNLWRVQNVAIAINPAMSIASTMGDMCSYLASRHRENVWDPQVKSLYSSLRKLERIRLLHISMWTGVTDVLLDRWLKMLRPLKRLTNVETLSWDGGVTDTVGIALKGRIGDSWTRYSFMRLPLELREKIYEYLIPCHTTVPFTSKPAPGSFRGFRDLAFCPPLRQDRGYTAMLRTCRRVHEEATRLLYSSNIFRIRVSDFLVLGPASMERQIDREVIGDRNFERIRRFEVFKTGKCCKGFEGWCYQFSSFLDKNSRIETLTFCCECGKDHLSAWVEVYPDSFLGKKRLKYINST